MIRKLLHKILGLDKVITQLNGRVTLIENIVGINNFMSIGEGNIGSGNVGVGSTVPPDVARYQELVKAQGSGNVGDGNVGDGNVGDGNVGDGNIGDGNIGDVGNVVAGNVGDGNVGDGNVGDGNVGDGNIGDGTSEADGWPRSHGNVGTGSA
jgi:PPE-repeat protein